MKNIYLVCALALVASGVNPVGASDSLPDALSEQVIIDRDPIEDAAVEALDAAQGDLKRGDIIIIRHGHPAFISDRLVEEMKSQFGIVLKKAGCVSTDISIAYAMVYNAVMQRAILAKFGKTLAQIERSVEANQPPEAMPVQSPPSKQSP